MIHGLSNEFLYSAKRIVTHWSINQKNISLIGTGFFISKDSNIYLITNRHVIELTYSHPEYKDAVLKQFLIEGYECVEEGELPTQYSTIIINNPNDFVVHTNEFNDIACLKNPKVNTSISKSSTISLPIGYEMLATNEDFNTKLLVCDTIAYPGFPEWYDKKNRTPIFRMGTIASDPRVGYAHKDTAPNADRVAYEGFSTSGASGSPVFAIQRGFAVGKGINVPEGFYRQVMLVGINAGHFSDVENHHSGISIFYKSSAIIELINLCDAKDKCTSV